MKLHTSQGRVGEVMLLRTLFNNPEALYQRGMDEFINGLTGEASQSYDPHFTEEVNNLL